MTRIHYEIPDDLHREIKADAARRGQTLKAYVEAALRQRARVRDPNKPLTPAEVMAAGPPLTDEEAATLRDGDVVVVRGARKGALPGRWTIGTTGETLPVRTGERPGERVIAQPCGRSYTYLGFPSEGFLTFWRA